MPTRLQFSLSLDAEPQEARGRPLFLSVSQGLTHIWSWRMLIRYLLCHLARTLL